MKKMLLIVAAFLAALFVVVIVVPFAVQKVATAPMVAVADRVSPEPGWVLEDEVITGGPLCSPVVIKCDSMHRRYRTTDHLTEAKLKALVAKSGLDLVTDGPCEPKLKSSGMQRLCGASGTENGFKVFITVAAVVEGGPELISVQVEQIKN